MKLIAKTKKILLATKAETMSEVLVAFLVLSIILVLFAQGIRFATAAEGFAVEKTKDSDKAMQALLDTVVSNPDKQSGVNTYDEEWNCQGDGNYAIKDDLKLTRYKVTLTDGGDSNVFYYYVFDADQG